MDSIVHVQYLVILHLTDRIDSTIYQYYYLYKPPQSSYYRKVL